MRTKVHAPDGGMFDAALCESVTGDTAYRLEDVDCPECLDAIDAGAPWRERRIQPVL